MPSSRPPVGASRLIRPLGGVGKYLVLVLFSAFFMIPLVWMVSTSLKNAEELPLYPPIWIPDPIRWDNYVTAFVEGSLGGYLWNTVVVTVPSVIGAVLSNALIAYGFAPPRPVARARLRLRRRAGHDDPAGLRDLHSPVPDIPRP